MKLIGAICILLAIGLSLLPLPDAVGFFLSSTLGVLGVILCSSG